MYFSSKCLAVLNRMRGQPDHRLGHQNLRIWGWLLLMALCLWVVGCTRPLPELSMPTLPASTSTEPMTVTLSQIDVIDEGLQISLSGTQAISYRLINHHQPFQLTIEVPQARIEQPQVQTLGYGGVKVIRLSQVEGSETLARLEIDLADDAHYSVSKGQKQVTVLVQAPNAPVNRQPVSLQAASSDAVKTRSEALPKTPQAKEYRVGSGDMLAVTVYDEPDLTLQRRVTERGQIDFPLIGKVHVAGLTAMQVEARLESSLSPGYLLDPQVFVDVVEFASKKIFIVGAVAKPTALSLRGETSLLDVLSQIESLSQSHSLTVFRRTSMPGRQGDDRHDVQAIHVDLNDLLRRGDMSINLTLQAQDVIYIPRPDAVFVFGEVANAGPVPLPEGGMTLVEAINKAGGFSKFASSRRTRVLRMVDGQEKVIQVDMAAVIRGDLGKDITLRSNDIVIVPESVF